MRRFPFVFVLLLWLLALPAVAQMVEMSMNAPQLYEKGLNDMAGIGESRNEQGAKEFFLRSANLSYAPAQVMMGYFYETGTAVTADPAQSLEWYKKADKQGDRLGSWLLGRLYYTGSGTAKDMDQAAIALQRAAAQGDPYGQYLLGKVKLERNEYPKAAEWFRKSAMQGLPQAEAELGLLLRDGKGVTANKSEGYMWLLMSFNAGNQAVVSDIQTLEGQLSASDVELAKAKARDLEQTVTRAVVARGCTGWPGEFNAVPAPPPPDIQSFCR